MFLRDFMLCNLWKLNEMSDRLGSCDTKSCNFLNETCRIWSHLNDTCAISQTFTQHEDVQVDEFLFELKHKILPHYNVVKWNNTSHKMSTCVNSWVPQMTHSSVKISFLRSLSRKCRNGFSIAKIWWSISISTRNCYPFRTPYQLVK